MPPRAARKKSKKKPLKLVNRKVRKKASYILTTVFLLGISSILFFSAVMYKRMNTVFASAQSVDAQNFDEKDIFTILLVSADDISKDSPHIKSLKLVIMDKKDNELSLVNLGNQQDYEVPGKFGKEKAFNLMALSNSVNTEPKEAEKFFVKTVENNLMFKIDRYVYVNHEQYSSVESTFGEPSTAQFVLLLKDFALNNLQGNLHTDVTDRELYAFFEFLSNEPLTISKSEKDYPALLKNIVANSNIADEKFMISILNGAQISGAGNYASEVVERVGGRVTFVGNAKNDYSESVIVTDNPESQSVKYLRSFFKVDKIEKKTKYSLIESDVERADVTLILGLDFNKNIY